MIIKISKIIISDSRQLKNITTCNNNYLDLINYSIRANKELNEKIKVSEIE